MQCEFKLGHKVFTTYKLIIPFTVFCIFCGLLLSFSIALFCVLFNVSEASVLYLVKMLKYILWIIIPLWIIFTYRELHKICSIPKDQKELVNALNKLNNIKLSDIKNSE
jgi:hypothetical protein